MSTDEDTKKQKVRDKSSVSYFSQLAGRTIGT